MTSNGLRGCTAVIVLVAAGQGEAAWLVEPAVEVSTGYESNVLMDFEDEQDAIVSEVAAQARVRRVTESSEISGIVGASYLMYSNTDVDGLDDEDTEFVALDAGRRFERASLGIGADYRRDLMLRRLATIEDVAVGATGGEGDAGEMPELIDDPFVTDDIDLNAVNEQVRRTRFRVAPYFEYQLGEVTEARLTFDYSERTFDDDGQELGLRDTSTSEVTASLRRAFTPRTAWWVRGGYARLEADGFAGSPSEEADNYTGIVGFDHRFSPLTSLSLEGGVSYSKNPETDEDDTGFNYAARFTRLVPEGRLTIGANRSTQPSSYGQLVEATRLDATYQRSLSERIEFGFGIYGYRTTEVGSEASNRDDRDYIDLEPRLIWRMTNSWNLGASYRYRWNDRTLDSGESGTADSHFVSVFLNFQPPGRL